MRFAAADKVWKNLMKASVETKNVVQVRSLRYTDSVVVLICKQRGGTQFVCACVFFRCLSAHTVLPGR